MKERVTLKREDQKKTLADQAYKQIEEAIVTLQLAPGSIVSETELVELIGNANPRGHTAASQGSTNTSATKTRIVSRAT